MKTLIITRHGKSGWELENIKDIDRPLKERGINNAHTIANELKKINCIPDKIISSPANRALHTSSIICREMRLDFNILYIDEDIYFREENDVEKIIRKQEASTNTLMVVGHNPTFTILINILSGKFIDNLPTAGTCIVKYNTDSWSKIDESLIESCDFIFPNKF